MSLRAAILIGFCRLQKRYIGFLARTAASCSKSAEAGTRALPLGPSTTSSCSSHSWRQLAFNLAQECFWYNPAKMPAPAEWVTVRRIRVRDSVEYVWWFSKTPWPKASNYNVLKGYSPDMIRLAKNGVRETVRPSGHVIRNSFEKVNAGGATRTSSRSS